MNIIIKSDCIEGLKKIPDNFVNCCVTSPPYFGLRDYGVDGQIGLEPTPQDFVNALVAVFREVKRVLRDDGTLWLNLGDSYVANKTGSVSNKCIGLGGGTSTQQEASKRPNKKAVDGLKQKDLIGIPWRVAFALQADGWYLRQDIIWHKPNPMPESVTDRCTKSHEYIFMLSKSPKYYFDNEAIKEPIAESTKAWGGGKKGFGASNINHKTATGIHGPSLRGEGRCGENGDTRNKRDVWTVATNPCKEAHFATFPPDLIRPCILSGAPIGGLVLDPFMGAGTTALVALKEHRKFLGFELNPEYIKIAYKRISSVQPNLI